MTQDNLKETFDNQREIPEGAARLGDSLHLSLHDAMTKSRDTNQDVTIELTGVTSGISLTVTPEFTRSQMQSLRNQYFDEYEHQEKEYYNSPEYAALYKKRDEEDQNRVIEFNTMVDDLPQVLARGDDAIMTWLDAYATKSEIVKCDPRHDEVLKQLKQYGFSANDVLSENRFREEASAHDYLKHTGGDVVSQLEKGEYVNPYAIGNCKVMYFKKVASTRSTNDALTNFDVEL